LGEIDRDDSRYVEQCTKHWLNVAGVAQFNLYDNTKVNHIEMVKRMNKFISGFNNWKTYLLLFSIIIIITMHKMLQEYLNLVYVIILTT